MLTTEDIYRQIDADNTELIEQVVAVEYDNATQAPLAFKYRGQHHEVLRVISTLPAPSGDPSRFYIVSTRSGIYVLYLDLWDDHRAGHLLSGKWVLHFRVQEEVPKEQKEVPVEMHLKLSADFHGHLCPDLVIGYRACKFALSQLGPELAWAPDSRVVAENMGSALDAIQRIMRCTVGNGRLEIRDQGKHVYTFINGEGSGLRVALRAEILPSDGELLSLEERIKANQATLTEVARYQRLLDSRVAWLLSVPDDAAFSFRRLAVAQPDRSATSALAACAVCGEVTISSYLVVIAGKVVCQGCAQTFKRVAPDDGLG
ncbi:MAG: FmdE family protein [Chloroflexota bacterium]